MADVYLPPFTTAQTATLAPTARASSVTNLRAQVRERSLQLLLIALLLPPRLLPTAVQFGLSLVLLAVASCAFFLESAVERIPLRFGAPITLLFGFWAWALVTLTWTADIGDGLALFRRYGVLLVVLLLVANHVRDFRSVERVMNALALAGWTIIASSLFTLLTNSYPEGRRLAVLGLNENQVGNMLLLLSVGVLWRAARPSSAPWNRDTVLACLYLGTSLAVIALTGSRGSILGFGLLILALFAVPSLRSVAVLATLVTGTLLVIAPTLFSTVGLRFTTSSSELSRGTLWSAGVALAEDHPWGAGLGEGPALMRDYIDRAVSTDHFVTRSTYPAHNPLIEVADDTGLVGVTLYGSALVAAGAMFVGAAVRMRRTDERLSRLVTVIAATSGPFLFVWAKSGGASYHVTTFLLVALWVVTARLAAAPLRPAP